jgi:hypothetical protein
LKISTISGKLISSFMGASPFYLGYFGKSFIKGKAPFFSTCFIFYTIYFTLPYFLDKLPKRKGVTAINTTRVYPSSRQFERVPFGTGKRIARFLEEKSPRI